MKASEALAQIFNSRDVEALELAPEDGDEVKQDLLDRGYVMLLDGDDFIVFAKSDFDLEDSK